MRVRVSEVFFDVCVHFVCPHRDWIGAVRATGFISSHNHPQVPSISSAFSSLSGLSGSWVRAGF